jgi:hypothetical protein
MAGFALGSLLICEFAADDEGVFAGVGALLLTGAETTGAGVDGVMAHPVSKTAVKTMPVFSALPNKLAKPPLLQTISASLIAFKLHLVKGRTPKILKPNNQSRAMPARWLLQTLLTICCNGLNSLQLIEILRRENLSTRNGSRIYLN